jgi:hypothetical protein
LGLDPDTIVRLEHDATNHSKRMEPVHLQITSVELMMGSGNIDRHTEKAVRFIDIPTTGSVILYREAALRAIDAGVLNKHGARVPLSPSSGGGGGQKNEREPIGPIAKELTKVTLRLADKEGRAEAMARNILKELLDAGIVLVEGAPIPKYKPNGSLNGRPEHPSLFRAENAPSRKHAIVGTEAGHTTVVTDEPGAGGANSTPDSQ